MINQYFTGGGPVDGLISVEEETVEHYEFWTGVYLEAGERQEGNLLVHLFVWHPFVGEPLYTDVDEVPSLSMIDSKA